MPVKIIKYLISNIENCKDLEIMDNNNVHGNMFYSKNIYKKNKISIEDRKSCPSNTCTGCKDDNNYVVKICEKTKNNTEDIIKNNNDIDYNSSSTYNITIKDTNNKIPLLKKKSFLSSIFSSSSEKFTARYNPPNVIMNAIQTPNTIFKFIFI